MPADNGNCERQLRTATANGNCERQLRTATANGNCERQRPDLNADYADYADLSEPREGLTARHREHGAFLGTAARDATGASRAAIPNKSGARPGARAPVMPPEQSA